MTGMVFTNAANVVVIDDQFKNYAMRSKGAITSSADPYSTQGRGLFQITVSGNNPVLAWTSAVGVVMAARVQTGSSTFTFYCYTETQVTTLTYYVFDEPVPTSTWGGGRVYSAAAALVFDALLKYMRVVDLVAINVGPTGGSASRSYDNTHTYACAQMTPGLRWTAVSGPVQPGPGTGTGQVITQHNKFAAFGKAGQGSAAMQSLLTYTYSTTQAAGAPDVDTGATQGLFLIVDVTNF